MDTTETKLTQNKKTRANISLKKLEETLTVVKKASKILNRLRNGDILDLERREKIYFVRQKFLHNQSINVIWFNLRGDRYYAKLYDIKTKNGVTKVINKIEKTTSENFRNASNERHRNRKKIESLSLFRSRRKK